MKKLLALAFLGMLTTTGALAQGYDELAYYSAWIGPEDMVNSRGQKLTSVAAAIQQDRANYHRFGLRQVGDEYDPVFSDRAQRARIPEIVDIIGEDGLKDELRIGQGFYVSVFVCGYPGRPTYMAVLPDWVEDFSGCF